MNLKRVGIPVNASDQRVMGILRVAKVFAVAVSGVGKRLAVVKCILTDADHAIGDADRFKHITVVKCVAVNEFRLILNGKACAAIFLSLDQQQAGILRVADIQTVLALGVGDVVTVEKGI